MIYISHRGNINGKNTELENNPNYIDNALNEGFNVEVDVWFMNNNFLLGHDKGSYKVDFNYLKNSKIWCHAKNIEAMLELKKHNCIYFWHQNDDVTLTSNGYFWTFPGKIISKNSICVLPEMNSYKKMDCAGICSDFIKKYKND